MQLADDRYTRETQSTNKLYFLQYWAILDQFETPN